MLGAGLGGLTGGALGYQFGSGLGQAFYTAVGVIAGGRVGHVLGNRFLPSDIFEFKRTALRALAGASDDGVRT